MHPVLFTLPGGMLIYGYGFMLLLGILAAVFGAAFTASRDGIPTTRLDDIGIISFV
jgi:prolipoprotein diacylglyceryltransferase